MEKIDLWNLDPYLKEKWKLWFQDFNIKWKYIIFTIPFAWTAPESLWLNLFSDDASLKYFLGDSTRKHVFGRCHSPALTQCTCVHGTCQLPRYTSLVLNLSLCTVECYRERRSFVPCCVLCLTGCLESHRCSIKVCPMSDPFINTNINKYICNVFKIVPGTHSGPN